MQVTAYSVIGENGQTGILPTGVNFQVGSSSYGTTTDGKSAYMGGSSQAISLHTSIVFGSWEQILRF